MILISDDNSLVDNTLSLVEKAQAFFPGEPIFDPVLLGIEGFMDMIWSVVRVRHSETQYELMDSITEWSERIANAAGASADIECILKRAAVGGYTGNVGKALSTLCGRTGNINCVGLYGLPSMKQIFQDQLINEYNCVLHSMGNPGECNAYEFSGW